MPNLINSGLSGPFAQNGIKISVQIYRLERDPVEWTLEVVNEKGTSIVWDDVFPTDEAAYSEFQRTVSEEGMQVFLDTGNVIPFRR